MTIPTISDTRQLHIHRERCKFGATPNGQFGALPACVAPKAHPMKNAPRPIRPHGIDNEYLVALGDGLAT